MSRLMNRLQGRVYGWFGSKDARPVSSPLPANFSRRAQLLLTSLEDRTVPATFTVTNTNDSGLGSLRQAITDSLVAGADNIVFNLGTGAKTISLLTALPAITAAGGNLTITAPGADLLTVNRGVATALNQPFNFAGTNTYVLSDFTISGFSGSSNGGAINVSAAANMTLNRMSISNNISSGFAAGLYMVASGTLAINDSSFVGNTSTSNGGAIRMSGSAAGSSATITNSTFFGNKAVTGGALLFNSFGGTGVTVNIRNSTITGNTATFTGTTAGYGGGGIARAISTTYFKLNVENSIVSGNSHTGGSANKQDITVNAGAVLNIDANSVVGIVDNNGSFSGTITDPQLSTIGNYGGKTPTMIPLLGSPAINKYDPGVAGFDQRGLPRPATGADVGSVERQANEVPTYLMPAFATVTADDATTNPYYMSITFNDVNTGSFDNSDIRVTGPEGFNTLATFDSFTGNSATATAKYKITPPVNDAAGWDGSDGGLYSVFLEGGQVSGPGGFVGATSLGTFQVSIPNTYTVTNLADSGAGSLRQAILRANANINTADTIVFQNGLSGTITLTTGQLLISDPLTINGPGADLVTISGGGATRHFALNGTGVIDVTMRGLKLSGGNGSTGAATNVFADGGSITSTDENLTLENMVLTSNSSSGANDGGAITLTSSGNLIIRNSTLSGNVAGSSAGADGGVLYINLAGNVTIENSTLSGNSANGRGGALYLRNGTQIISNTTISGNTTSSAAGTGGGGIAVLGTTGSVSIRNSTIVNNSSISSSTTAGANGGGIASTPSGVPLTFESSIVAGNSSSTTATDISSAAAGITLINSAVGVATGFTQDGSSANNLAFGINLKLGALQSNGGIGFTHLPAADSPLLDKGTNSYGLTTDQRGGGTNTAQFPRSKGTTDIGAVEAGEAVVPTATSTVTNVDINQLSQTTYTFTVTYADPLSSIVFESFNDSDEIRVTGPNGFNILASFVSVDAPSDGSPRTATYTFTAPVNDTAGFDGSDNGSYSVSVEPNQVKNANNLFISPGVIGSFTVLIPYFKVTNASDSGGGSLRQALLFANSTAGLDEITFDPTFFATAKTINLVTALSALSETVTITGPGSGKLTISAAGITGSRQIFNTTSAPNGAEIRITGMTLTGASFTGNGGAISIGDENVSLTDTVITGNSSSSAGGGINVTGAATLSIAKSTLSNNVAGTIGGAIFTDVAATLTIDASTLSGNTAKGTSFGGGALYITGGSTTITNSTLSGNSAAGSNGGGALYTWSTPTAVVISNSTFANNTASTNGGAIRIQSGPLTLRNSTIVGNSAIASATAGGGISFIGSGLITIESTVVAGNSAAGSANDINAGGTTTVDAIHSAWTSSYTPNGLNDSNLINADYTNMAFGPLTVSGGTTATLVPGASSILLNKGSNSQAYTTDQRGAGFSRERPTGFPDIGAVEVPGVAPVALIGALTQVTSDQPGTNNPYTFTVTYADDTAISVATVGNQPDDDITITKVGGGFSVTATFVSADQTVDSPVVVAHYKFTPPGNSWDASDAGKYQFSVPANTVKNSNNVGISAATLGSFNVNFPTTYVVTNTNDSGTGSLRQAILDANTNSVIADTIVFEATTFSTPQTITLTGTELLINDGLTIQGPGKGLLTVNGNGTHRIFNINNSVAGNAIDVVIQDMTLTNASISGSGGAVVIQDENVTFTRTNFIGNKASTSGAAIQVTLPANNTLTVYDSTFSGGSATTDGGAINVLNPSTSNEMTLLVRNTSFTSNTAGDDGGAINLGSSTLPFNVLIESSLFASNVTGKGSTTGDGSALYFRGAVGTNGFVIRNSTVSGNSAGFSTANTTSVSAALAFPLVSGNILIQNSTIVNNTSTSTSTDSFDGGGGIAISTGLVFLESSIVAGNVSANGHPDISSENGVTYSYSAIGVSSFFDGPTLNNIPFGTDLNYGPLTNNGGQFPSHAILAGSPLFNAGTATTTPGFPDLTTDVRGFGFARLVGVAVDIGSFERIPGVPSATAGSLPSVISDQPGTNNPYTFTVSYSDDTLMSVATIGNQPNDDITITKVGGGFSTTATFVSADSAIDAATIVATYKFTPPGGSWDGNDNGSYQVLLPANAVKNSANVSVPATTLGTIVVNAPAPAAVASAATVTIDDASTNPYKFTVTYSDANAIDTSTIINNNSAIRVTGPNGYDVPATYVGINDNINGTPRIATYQITAPVNSAAGWDISDNGSYSIIMQGSQVKNLQNTFVPAGSVGSFTANIGGLILVTNTNDSGVGSLRDAVALANVDPSPDTIIFSSLFNTPQTITLTTGQMLITKSVTIDGPGANLLSINAGNASRHFYIDDGNKANSIDVTIKEMKLYNGSVTGVSGISLVNRGGSINYTDEKLTVDGVWLTNNYTDSAGGAIGGGGDSIFSGYLYIYNSTITNNSAKGGDSIMGGGGVVFVRTLDGEIKNSTIAFNTVSTSQGGGVMFYGTGTNPNGPRAVRVENSTIVNNSSSGTGGGTSGTSPGSGDSFTLSFKNTIVADNTGSNTNQIVFGSILADYSAFTTNASVTGANNISTAGLNLGVLQNNGGPMPTIALGTGSTAINTGSPTSNLATDQRGAGFARVVGTATDIGSFEVQPATPVALNFTVNNGDAQRSRIIRIDVTFNNPVTAANFNSLGAITLTRTGVSSTPTGVIGDTVQTGPATNNNHITVTQGSTNTLILTFDNAGSFITNSIGVESGSLTDGYWKLQIDSYSSATGDLALRRLYGDSSNSAGGTVNGSDLTDFGNVFSTNNIAFDFNNDGTINGSDLVTFGNRFSNTL
ncbi:hypothetical protein BH11PLA2_BH11PLA2_40180 [soil metagenome]